MRRSLSVVTSFVLAAGLIVGASPGASAATCSVTNEGTGTTYTTLQEAVDDAASGDTLEVRGTCIGVTVIRATRLRLKGIATTEQPTPTLDGARLSSVLTVVNAKVVTRDLTITNGKARYGGGISADRDQGARAGRARVTLRGDTSVTGNTARVGGGGISNSLGTLTLNDSASVTGNMSDDGGGGIMNLDTLTLNGSSSVTGNNGYFGGGITNSYGTLTLNGSASVTGNTAGYGGGGISNSGTIILNDSVSVADNTSGEEGGGIMNLDTLTLNGSSSVTGNTAGYGGGGISNGEFGTVTLNDSASVTGNTAEVGGGILNVDRYDIVYVCSDEVAISPNDPDHPPKVRRVRP